MFDLCNRPCDRENGEPAEKYQQFGSVVLSNTGVADFPLLFNNPSGGRMLIQSITWRVQGTLAAGNAWLITLGGRARYLDTSVYSIAGDTVVRTEERQINQALDPGEGIQLYLPTGVVFCFVRYALL